MHYRNYFTGQPRFHFDENANGQQQQQQAPVWHDGVDAEVKGFWQNKGLPLDNPKEFGLKLTELYRGAEKFIGAPPDQLVKLPKADAKPEDIRAFYERLGAPKDAKEYDFATVKHADGSEISAGLADSLRAESFARGLKKDDATALAAAVVKSLDSEKSTQKTVADAKLTDEKAKLAKDWGANFEFNRLKAMEGVRRSGISPEGVAALESQIGYAAVMDHFRKIGSSTAEDIFVERGHGSNGQVTTREGAIARRAELKADKAWAARYLSGDQTAKREMDQLNMMIDG